MTLVDRENYTLFQPLVYQVATGALSPAEIAMPLRTIFRRQRNVRVVLGEVTGFDLERREVVVDRLPNGDGERRLGYDTLRRDFRDAHPETARVLLVEAVTRGRGARLIVEPAGEERDTAPAGPRPGDGTRRRALAENR